MNIVTTLLRLVYGSVFEALEALLISVDAHWRDNNLLTIPAIAATQRLLRMQERIEVLLVKFRAGKLQYRRRRPRAEKPAEQPVPDAVELSPEAQAAAADALEQKAAVKAHLAEKRRRAHNPLRGLPPYFGCLSDIMPNVATFLGSELQNWFATEEMQQLMLATPEVARIAGPVFRMFGLEEHVLLVPVEYAGPPLIKNKPFMRPAKTFRAHRPVSDYQPECEVPEDYDEDRDGRKPHPLREPTWDYWNYVDYRSYLYYYMKRAPKRLRLSF